MAVQKHKMTNTIKTQMEIVLKLECDCTPGFTYASRTSLLQHFKSKKHLSWMQSKSEHDLRIQLGLREKEIAILNRRLSECEATLALYRKSTTKTREELKAEINSLIQRMKNMQ